MKKSPVLLVLAGLQLLAAIALGAACYLQIKYSRELEAQNFQLVRFNTDRQFVMSLVNDCAEYSRKNPAMDPILASIGVKSPRTGPTNSATAPGKPAAKPAGR